MVEILIIVALLLIIIPGILFYFLQHKLVFNPKHHLERSWMITHAHAYHLQEMEVAPGIMLEGIVYEPEKPSTTLLYFGGRSQDSVALIGMFSEHCPDIRIVTFNFRGYGESGGQPAEDVLLEDGLKIFDWCAQEYGETALLGFSLGSSVAAYVGSHRHAQKVVLVAAFSSVAKLMQAKLALLPNFIIRHHFDTAAFVQNILSPLYLYVAEDDLVVPISHARNLKENVRNLAEYSEFSGYEHKELLFSDEVIEKLKKVFAR